VFADLRIRNKLIVLVAGPIVVLVVLAGLGAQARRDTAGDSRRVERLVAVARANADVVDALQQESLFSTAHVAADRAAWDGELEAARVDTDGALAGALDRLASNRATSPAFRSTATLANDAAEKLVYIRAAVDQGYTWDQVATTYTSLQTTFLAVNDTVGDALTDFQVGAQLRTGAALGAYKAAIAQQGSLLVGAAQQGGFEADGSSALFGDAVAAEQSQEAILASVADSTRKGRVRDALTSELGSTWRRHATWRGPVVRRRRCRPTRRRWPGRVAPCSMTCTRSRPISSAP
jgi:hypothetical protein